ncbi:zonadhesin [Aphomia sociella]
MGRESKAAVNENRALPRRAELYMLIYERHNLAQSRYKSATLAQSVSSVRVQQWYAIWSRPDCQVATLCRSNERLLACGGCQKTCVDPVPRCEGVCKVGCYCQEGEVRNATGHCVKLADCPPMVYKTNPDDVECPLNEEYKLCESCNKTCDNPNPICPAQCAKGCFCQDGLVRDKDGTCVKYERCSKFTQIECMYYFAPLPHQINCGPHQVFKICENCEKTCSNPNPICPAQCTKGCFCDDGFYKSPNGNCVKLEDCPEAEVTMGGGHDTTIDDCHPDEEYFSCGWCEPSCSDPHPECPLKICTSGCLCKPPLLRHRSGHCVQAEHCLPHRKLLYINTIGYS